MNTEIDSILNNEYSENDSDSDVLSEYNLEFTENIPIWAKKKILELNPNQILYSSNAIDIIRHISVWDKQRILSEMQVSEILEFQLNYYKKFNNFNFIGPFYICSVNNEDYRIIDGQHRLVTIHRLIEKYNFNSFDIVSWVINVNNEQERYEIFKNINSSKPISIPDLLLDKTSNIINECCLKLYHKYPKFFQNTAFKKVHRPNLKLDLLKNNLYDKKIVELLNIETHSELFEIIIDLNNYYLNKDHTYFPKIRNTKTENILKRAINKGKLLLGMFPNYEWIDNLIEIKLFNKQQESKISSVSNSINEDDIYKNNNSISDLNISYNNINNNSPIRNINNNSLIRNINNNSPIENTNKIKININKNNSTKLEKNNIISIKKLTNLEKNNIVSLQNNTNIQQNNIVSLQNDTNIQKNNEKKIKIIKITK